MQRFHEGRWHRIPKVALLLKPAAALAALRDLTGRDTASTAPAWRQLLNLTN
jgi:hypothetical protein